MKNKNDSASTAELVLPVEDNDAWVDGIESQLAPQTATISQRFPSSTVVSLILTVGLAVLYATIRLLYDGAHGQIAQETVIFAIICFAFSLLFLKWLVFRNLKNIDVLQQKEIEKLKNLENYRRDFLAEVSHELKTPIFAIQGFIHTLIDGAMDDENVRVKFLKKAMKNSDRLSNLVEDLLVITQAESGEMEIRYSDFFIYDLILDVVESLEYKLTRKNRNISYKIAANDLNGVQVRADRERIHQVVSNLVDNAIKYGDSQGKVTIELNDHAEKIYVSVIDEGPGIEEEHLAKIFTRFYRVDKSRSREKGGTGLGLAICKHLLTVHGEKIFVKSTLGSGTSFTFTLTKAQVPELNA